MSDDDRERADAFSFFVRCEAELAARLDAEVERLKRDMPGSAWTRTGVIRMALERYLRSPLRVEDRFDEGA